MKDRKIAPAEFSEVVEPHFFSPEFE